MYDASPGAYLCHYTRAETAFARILPSGKLRMNAYQKMRDPFENKRPHLIGTVATGYDDDGSFDEDSEQAAREVGKARDRYCLLSLTRGNNAVDDVVPARFASPWARARMWEQYAEAHAGVCLAFDRQPLIATIETGLADHGELWHQAVNYTPEGFAGSAGAILSIKREMPLAEYVRDHVLRYHEDFFFLKTDDWASEFEYRFVWRRPDDDVLLGLIPPVQHVRYGDTLRYIILGEKFPDWLLPSARLAAENCGAELREMDWERGPHLKPLHAGR